MVRKRIFAAHLNRMKPIETFSLFEELNQELVYFLADLSKEEWLLPTALPDRTVKDIAAHLADGSLRRISMQRDHFFVEHKLNLNQLDTLVEYIQQLNREWIVAMRRVSPRLLVEMIKKYDKEVFELFSSLKPDDNAMLPVAWAFQQSSPNWFDIAREYTERWHHQMQMRLATGRPLLMSERFLKPVYETFLLALPAHLNNCYSPTDDQLLVVELFGEIQLRNRLQFKNGRWDFCETDSNMAKTIVRIPASIGWMLFTNTDRNIDNHLDVIKIEGDRELAKCVLSMKTVLS